jgi:hypothetical protein
MMMTCHNVDVESQTQNQLKSSASERILRLRCRCKGCEGNFSFHFMRALVCITSARLNLKHYKPQSIARVGLELCSNYRNCYCLMQKSKRAVLSFKNAEFRVREIRQGKADSL